MTIHLPTLNAILNSLSAILLLTGFYFIKRGNRVAHKKCMIGTFAISVLFLVSYLSHHAMHGSTKFLGEGAARTVYFTILTTHTILAAIIVPLAIITLRRGLQSTFIEHRRIAKWTFPIWMYVSVTGVVIYLMLYQWYPHS